jgi:hypothetical protein
MTFEHFAFGLVIVGSLILIACDLIEAYRR